MNDVSNASSDGLGRTILRYLLAGLSLVPAGVGYALLQATGRDGWLAVLALLALGLGTALWVTDRALLPDSKREWSLLLKRTVDVLFASIGLFVELPLFVAIAIAIGASSRGPVFFRKECVGFRGRPFALLKFRTVYHLEPELAAGPVWAREADSRVTPVGRFLRRTRLDELPLLLNVLRGDMSLVGPRPLEVAFRNALMDVVPHETHRTREAVRPGITGWAQISTRYDDLLRMLESDRYYVDNWSLRSDFAVIARTVKIVLFARETRSEAMPPVAGRLAFGILISPWAATLFGVIVWLARR